MRSGKVAVLVPLQLSITREIAVIRNFEFNHSIKELNGDAKFCRVRQILEIA